MDSQRVLIVESDNGFALSIAAVLQEAGYSSAITLSAADAQRELRERRPDLIILRAELPDLSGFAFCGRLRKDKTAQGLPIILVSSDATAEALAQHRSRPASAADGYLSMPFPMEELLGQARDLLGLAGREGRSGSRVATPPLEIEPLDGPREPVNPGTFDEIEGALDGALGEALHQVVTLQGGAASGATTDPSPGIAGIEAMIPPPPPRPPRLPKRPRRSALTDEDRSFMDRVFESIADRKTELLAESRNSARRPAVKRELLATPEGKLQILRDELNRREAQVARLSEIWGVRERELTSIDDKLHEKEVEIQGLKMQVDDLLRRLSDARDLFVKKDQEHGAAIDSMLLEKFVNEKELIEVVAGKEKDISLLRRDLHGRDDELLRRNQELDRVREEIARLEKLRQDELTAYEDYERDISARLARREVEIMGLSSELAQGLELLATLDAERTSVREAFQREIRMLKSDLAHREVLADFVAREHAADLRVAEMRIGLAEVALDDGRSQLTQEALELDAQLAETEEELGGTALETETLRVQRDGLRQSLETRLAASDAEAVRLANELVQEHEHAMTREGQLSVELAERAEQIGALQGELESVRHEKEQREAELQGELRHTHDRLEASAGEVSLLTQDVEMARGRITQLSSELDEQRARFDQAHQQAQDAHAELSAERDELRRELDRLAAELRDTLSAKAERERILELQLSEKVELTGTLEGELAAAHQHAKEREGTLDADLAASRAESARLSSELQTAHAEHRGIEQANAEHVAAMNAQLAEMGRTIEAERVAASEEQSRLLAETEELRARGEERSAELHAELTRRDGLAKDAEERSQQQLDELVGQVETLRSELAEKTRVHVEEEKKVQALGQEKARREEAIAREIAVRAEAAKTAERKLQRQIETTEERLRDADSQLKAQAQREQEVREHLASTEKTIEAHNTRFERATNEHELSRREWQNQLATREGRVTELQAALAQFHQERRRAEEDAVARLARSDGKIKDLEARLADAAAVREKFEREAQNASAVRARKIQELEQAVEASTGARVRTERELGQRASAAEAKSTELSQKLAQTQRLQRELEGRLQKETADVAAKMRAEIERRDAQRAQEIARLQQALQEKAKAMKVMELELQRVKNRAPSPAAATVRPPAPRRPPPAPPRPEESPLGELEPMADEPTQVITFSELSAQAGTPRSKDDPEEDLDAMLNKLEI